MQILIPQDPASPAGGSKYPSQRVSERFHRRIILHGLPRNSSQSQGVFQLQQAHLLLMRAQDCLQKWIKSQPKAMS